MSDCRFGVSPVNYSDPDPYRHDGRADKDTYRHDGRAYSLSRTVVMRLVTSATKTKVEKTEKIATKAGHSERLFYLVTILRNPDSIENR